MSIKRKYNKIWLTMFFSQFFICFDGPSKELIDTLMYKCHSPTVSVGPISHSTIFFSQHSVKYISDVLCQSSGRVGTSQTRSFVLLSDHVLNPATTPVRVAGQLSQRCCDALVLCFVLSVRTTRYLPRRKERADGCGRK